MASANNERNRIINLYLETSVWNFLHAPESSEMMEDTLDLFMDIKYQNLMRGNISTIVIDEINRSQFERRNILEGFISNYSPIVLGVTPEFNDLARSYLDSKIISPRYNVDLFHIAIATVHDMDIVASWNLRHIVKERTIRETNTINRTMGYGEIKIMTPQKVIDYVSRTKGNERDP